MNNNNFHQRMDCEQKKNTRINFIVEAMEDKGRKAVVMRVCVVITIPFTKERIVKIKNKKKE